MFTIGSRVMFTEYAIKRFSAPTYGCLEFKKFWKSVKNRPYWIVCKSPFNFTLVDDEIHLEGFNWCVQSWDVEMFRWPKYLTRRIKEIYRFFRR